MTQMLDDATHTTLRRLRKDIPAAHRQMALALHKDGLEPAEIARRLHERTGVLRRPATIRKVVERLERRAAADQKVRDVHARLLTLFNEGVQAEQAAKIIRREFNHHLSEMGVRSAWWKMGLRRARDASLKDRWRGKLPIPAHAHPLVREFFGHLNREMTTMQEVSERAGLQRMTISGWGRDRTPNIVTFEAALNVLDLELCIRPRKVPA